MYGNTFEFNIELNNTPYVQYTNDHWHFESPHNLSQGNGKDHQETTVSKILNPNRTWHSWQ
ncbi:hypothetical protein VP1G_11179 [Cytospora mali]|uniref:Uncharacterized protein n=1 Tax=Cytospora mali TaxID=578113 RepID=A0A194V7T5_CYTMA|nr:hypothetical protein VP1G_11179 [Valsa mali var. pyri (nom. inval.)]